MTQTMTRIKPAPKITVTAAADRATMLDSANGSRQPKVTPASAVERHAPRFIDYPLIPVGTITLIAGRAGVSKSTLILYRAALATKGLLDGDWKGTPVNVAVSGIEDTESMQSMRLEAEGADLERIAFYGMADQYGDSGVRIPEDLPALAESFKRNRIRMWIIDPITSAMDGDSNKRDDVRRALDPLAKFAADLDIAVVGILHFNKGGGYASDKISGSHAFRDAIRSLLLVARDDDNGDCVLTIDKSSYTTAQDQSYSYGLISCDITDDANRVFSVPKITGFMPTERNVNEVINKNMSVAFAESPRRSRGEVADWIIDYLTEHGPTPFDKIKTAADERGYTVKQLRKVRERHPGLISSAPDPNHTGRGQGHIWSVNDDSDDMDAD
ncbi:AAA family ATPase [Bifidobacterium simiiventris]|uniref:AAA family ATPase n=1 Tax=Bifidobacterium simiiventris TaxID=2834434 RepID=UPI001C585C5B|nr:AAA family ATPase [Bifidobacterium simiiventris]MBW3078229.1 AAA family ATPase [Bifidobacterium simiiventris]